MRIIADVDTGIDDACALLYLAGDPSVELLGVTTSAGNTTARQAALNSLHVLRTAGRPDVMVAVGETTPLKRPLTTTPETHGGSGLGHVPVPDLSQHLLRRASVEAWLGEFRLNPRRTSLLVTGPLTNLAIALRAEPNLPDLVHQIVIMGGSFNHLGNTTPTAEWNMWVDPDAAKEVFAAFEGWPEDRLPIICPLNVTEDVEFSPRLLDEAVEAAGGRAPHWHQGRPRVDGPQADTGWPVLDLLSDAMRYYFEFHFDHEQGYIAHLHDLFAAQVASGRAWAPMRTTVVDVEADSELMRGTTVRDDRGIWGRSPNARVVSRNDPERVFHDFAMSLRRLTRG